MAHAPIIVHVPAQAKEDNLPSVRRFYQRLLDALARHGFDVATPDQLFPPPSQTELAPDRLHITYHTRHTGANVINVKIGYLPDYFYFDDSGYSGWSMLAGRDLQAGVADGDAEAYYARRVLPWVRAGRSKYAQPPLSPNMLAPGYVAIFTQVQGDLVLDLARHESRDMVTAVLREARQLGIPAVLKLHPRCTDANFRAFAFDAARQYGAAIAHLNVHQIIAGARCVAVVNSGAGFEALCHLKPVLSFGASDYETAATPIHSLTELASAIAVCEPDAARDLRIKRFLFGYLNAQLDIEDPAFATRVVERVERKLATGKS